MTETGRDAAGAFVDDSTITATVRARLAEDGNVDASAISVETSNGTVVLSGFARSSLEKNTVGIIAMKPKGVKAVQNNVVVQP